MLPSPPPPHPPPSPPNHPWQYLKLALQENPARTLFCLLNLVRLRIFYSRETFKFLLNSCLPAKRAFTQSQLVTRRISCYYITKYSQQWVLGSEENMIFMFCQGKFKGVEGGSVNIKITKKKLRDALDRGEVEQVLAI